MTISAKWWQHQNCRMRWSSFSADAKCSPEMLTDLSLATKLGYVHGMALGRTPAGAAILNGTGLWDRQTGAWAELGGAGCASRRPLLGSPGRHLCRVGLASAPGRAVAFSEALRSCA